MFARRCAWLFLVASLSGALADICSDTNTTSIASIQGNSSAVASVSPSAGTSVSVVGVVTATNLGNGTRNGLYITDAQPDNDPATSDGVFVYRGSLSLPFNPAVGDKVLVNGSVSEFFGNTQITLSAIVLCASGVGIPNIPVLSTLPSEGTFAAVLEPLEGSRVVLTAPNLRVAENFQLGRFGQILVSSGDLIAPTQLALPGAPALALEASQAYVRLDDGLTNQNPAVVALVQNQLSLNNSLRVGTSLTTGIQGVVHQISNTTAPYYVIVPVEPLVVSQVPADTSPRPDSPRARPDATNVRVVAANLLNLFLGPLSQASRGANNLAEYTRQVTKIVNGLAAMDADVLGVVEIQNDSFGPSSTIANLTNLLNAKVGANTYAYIDPGYDQVGTDVITCKILYKPGVVQPVGPLAVLDSSVNSTYIDKKNRPTQAQTFVLSASGDKFTFVITHLKSKGIACTDVGDPDKGDGQGECAGVRTAAAKAIVSWLATDPTGSNDTDILLMGDMNAYALEDAIRELTELSLGNYTNLVAQYIGNDKAYTFVFDGRRAYLDHALASPSLAGQVLGISEWHINAAEPVVFDYNTEFKSASQVADWYTPAPVRFSDHDPLIVDLQLFTPPPPQPPQPPALAAPLLQNVTSPKKGFALLAFVDKSSNETAWRIQFSAYGFNSIAKTCIKRSNTRSAVDVTTTATVPGLRKGAKFDVRVLACDGMGNDATCGPPSNVVSVTVA